MSAVSAGDLRERQLMPGAATVVVRKTPPDWGADGVAGFSRRTVFDPIQHAVQLVGPIHIRRS